MTNDARSRFGRAVLWLNIIIMLFPPIHLMMASGNMPLALFYFLGSGAFLVVSMFWLAAGDDKSEEA
jgi:hypothetical protein